MRRLSLVFLLFLPTATLGGETHIAVAANFRQTTTLINTLFHERTGHQATLSSASTGALHSQITHGAPFDIFLSADSHSPTQLEEAGFSKPGNRFCYAMGQMVLTGGSAGLKALADPNLSLAIANPATAPYGRAAEELLDRPEYAAGRERKMVRANNVIQAFQYWYTGSVDLALVARSLAPEAGETIPQEWYTPIHQQAVLLKRGGDKPASLRYIEFLKSDEVQMLITNAGYGACQ